MANPVSILFELCANSGWPAPQLELKSRTGESHTPVFVFEIRILDWTAEGSGTSKQKAKHAAAAALLDSLQSGKLPNCNLLRIPTASTKADDASPSLPKIVKPNPLEVVRMKKNVEAQDINAIGRLQEMCIVRKWPPPIYVEASTEGLPHVRTFIMSCEIGNLCHNGKFIIIICYYNMDMICNKEF